MACFPEARHFEAAPRMPVNVSPLVFLDMELAGLVREGYMEREEALNRLDVPPSPEMVSRVAERLGVAIR